MSEALATGILSALGIYASLGTLFALPFYGRWLARLDPGAQQGTWGFRLLILPGVLALWPLLWLRVRAGAPQESNAHRRAARAPDEQVGAQ